MTDLLIRIGFYVLLILSLCGAIATIGMLYHQINYGTRSYWVILIFALCSGVLGNFAGRLRESYRRKELSQELRQQQEWEKIEEQKRAGINRQYERILNEQETDKSNEKFEALIAKLQGKDEDKK